MHQLKVHMATSLPPVLCSRAPTPTQHGTCSLSNRSRLSICTMDALGPSNSQNPARSQQFGVTTALTCESNFHLSQKPWLWYFPNFPHTLLNLQLSS